MRNNQYTEVFAEQAGIFRLSPLNLPQSRSAVLSKASLEASGLGMVMLDNETVTESGSRQEALVYMSDDSNSGMINLIVKNC